MKRLLTLLMAVLILGTLTIPVFADGNTTTLTTTVPEAEYTMTIPEDMNIAFGTSRVNIGQVNITPVKGFTSGKGVEVDITREPFSCPDVETTIPFSVYAYDKDEKNQLQEQSGDTTVIEFRMSDGTLKPSYIKSGSHYTANECNVILAGFQWAAALAGDYSATVTFTAKVIVV